ncbi:MAG: PAS domain S-box protein [Candidatus Hodarchaeales archaeon]
MLLVDDDLNLLGVAKVLLPREEPTINLITAASAQEALQKMREEPFDAVISDYKMSGMDGLAFLQTLRDEGNLIPFIIFTGQGREEVAMQALNLGADYYLMKGAEAKSTFGELAHIIRQVVQHKQTEDALILEREFTDNVINSLSDTFYIFDPEDGRAIRWNTVFEEIGGYSYEELKQNTPLDYYPPEEHSLIKEATREVMATGQSNVELTFIAKNGRRVPFEYSAVLIKSPEGKPWICAIGRDITERKQAEAMLHESEGRYRALVENGFDGVFIHQNYKFLDLNQQFADMIGAPRSALLGTDVLRLFPPELYEKIREYVQTGKGGLLESKLQRSDGSLISTESFGAPCLFQGEEARIVAIRDISKREQIENELKESEEKFRRIVEDQTEFIVRWLPGGVRTFVNDSYCRYLGKPAEELLGISFFPLIYEQDLAAVKKQLDTLSPENPISTDEHRVIRPDGTIGWNRWTDRAIFDDEGQLIEYQSVGQDITAQRQTEAALRESEERFRVIFQNAAIGMATGDMMGRVMQSNRALQRLIGYSEDELHGMNFAEFTHPDSVQKEIHLYEELMAGKRDQYQLEKRYIRKDGQLIWVRVTASLVRDEQGNPLFPIGMIEDITIRKQAEAALQESEQQFRAIFENVTIGMVVGSLEGGITATNAAFQEFLGYNAEEFKQITYREYTHPEDLPRDEALFQEMLDENRNYYQIEKRYIRKDGQIKWGRLTASQIRDESDSPPFGIGMVEDITDRKKAENALHMSEERFRSIYEQSPVAIEIYDREGQLIEANPECLRLFGIGSLAEVKGFKLFEDPNLLPDAKERLLKGEPVAYEAEFDFDLVKKLNLYQTSKSGQSFVDVFIAPLRREEVGDQPSGYLVQVTDITDRKEAEAELRMFKAISDHAGYGIGIISPEGDLIYINNPFAQMHGYTPEELLGKNFSIFHTEEQMTHVGGLRNQLLQEGTYVGEEVWHKRKDGTVFPTLMNGTAIRDDNGKLLYLAATAQDITQWKQTSEKLMESEERFAQFMDHLPAAAFIKDSEGRTLFANQYLKDAFGGETWLGKTTSELFPADVARKMIAADQKALDEGLQIIIENLQDIHGAVNTYQTYKFPIARANKPKLLGGIAINITERKQAEEALRESEQQFRAIFENVSVGMVAGSLEGGITATNAAFQEFLGYSAEELKQLTYKEYTHPEDLPRDDELYQERQEKKRSYYQIEKRYIRKDGQIRWGRLTSSLVLQESDSPPFGIGMVEDITERKQAEEALQESEILFQILLNATDDSVLLVNTVGMILAVNRAEMQRLNKTEEELLGSIIFDHFPPAMADQRRGAFEEVIQSGNSLHHVSEDSGRVFESNISPVFGPSGNVERIAIFSRDITNRKRIAEKLQQSEEQYRTLVEQSLQSLTIIQDDRVVFANPAAQQLTGYSLEEFSTFSLEDFNALIHPADLEMVLSRVRDRLAGKPAANRYECRMIHKDGSIRWAELHSIPTTFHERPAIQTAALDITDRKRAEERFRSIYEQSPIAIEIYNREGELIDANPECLRLFGIDSLTEVKGFKLFEDPNLPINAKKRLLKGEPIAYETEFDFELVKKHNLYQTSKTGQSFVDVLITPLKENEAGEQPSGYLVQVIDITERKQAEMAYQSVIESMVHGITIYQEGRFVFANRAMKEITGYRIEELLAFSDEETIGLVHPDDLEFLMKRQRDWQEGKPVHARYSHRLIRKDGTLRWIEGFTNPVEFQGKAATQQTIVDISDRKQAQELLQQQKKELSDFVHTMAHDLRTQLLSVEGYAETLQEEYNRAFVEKIQYLAQHMGQLLRRSVALADSGLVIERTADVDLTQLVQEISETAIPNNIDFVVDDLPIIAGDREKLAQVFQNLFENAATHGNPTKITVQRQKGERGTEIQIANDGKPISSEHRSKIFQRGFSTQEERSGLGLAIVQKLVAAHGWHIRLADTPETAFIIRIPTKS